MNEIDRWAENEALLKSVSRSFFLSIKFLPRQMREPIAIGYLLARLTDTIADSGEILLPERIQTLAALGQFDTSIDLAKYCDRIEHPGEKELLANAPQIYTWLANVDPVNQSSIRNVLKTIAAGQLWDLEHFSKTPDVSRSELLAYTYQVAGCVGEFWTEVGFNNLGKRFADPDNRSVMMERGKHLGQALQLINILRDVREDRENSRYYFSDESFPIWLEQCREFLEDGKRYVSLVKNARARFATVLPLYLAEETAHKIETAGLERVKCERVKIGKSVVWKNLIRAALFF